MAKRDYVVESKIFYTFILKECQENFNLRVKVSFSFQTYTITDNSWFKKSKNKNKIVLQTYSVVPYT